MRKILSFIKKYWLKFWAMMAYINTIIILTVMYIFILPFFAIPVKIKNLFVKNNPKWIPYDREFDIKEQF